MKEHATSSGILSVGASLSPEELGLHDTRIIIHRFEDGKAFRRAQTFLDTLDLDGLSDISYLTTFADGNLLLNGGINNLWNSLAGVSGLTPYNNANARIGVGDSTTAAVATQTGLQATTNVAYAGMAASFPTVGASQQAVFQSVFGSAVANYAWNEFVVDNGFVITSGIISLDRLVSAQGTKASGQTWTVTMTITLS